MVNHAREGWWQEQEEPDPEYRDFGFWFDLTVLNLVCPVCLGEDRVVVKMEQHDGTQMSPNHYSCPRCNTGIPTRYLGAWLKPALPTTHPTQQ